MRSKTTLGIAGSLATVLLGACGPLDDDCAETASCTTGVDAAAQSRTATPARPDAGTVPVALAPDEEAPDALSPDAAAEAAAPTCESRRADPVLGVFVAPSLDGGAADAVGCGRQSSPCATIGAALEQAKATGLANVYLAPGTYTANVQLAAGIALEGGWLEGTWAPDCASPTPTAVIEGAAAGATVAAQEIGGKAALRYLSIRSRPHESLAPGESAYGVLAAGASTDLELDHVAVHAADAADGVAGIAPHLAPTAPKGCATPGTGADNANEGAPGLARAGSFTADGYVAGDGATGDVGRGAGANGTVGGVGNCTTGYYTGHCLWTGIGAAGSCSQTPRAKERICGGTGRGGCGGGPGAGGRGGGGGGASIALYVWEANVAVRTSKLVAGNGGVGAPGSRGGLGGLGGAGAEGETAFTAADVCAGAVTSEQCVALNTAIAVIGGAPGGIGGRGAIGGKGGGGSGGDSHAVFHSGAVPLVLAGCDLAVGAAGPGADGAPSGAASISDIR